MFEVTYAKNNVYTVVCGWPGCDGLEVDDISVNDLKRYENLYVEGEDVLYENKSAKIAEAHADGTYVLRSGKEVTEDELEKEEGKDGKKKKSKKDKKEKKEKKKKEKKEKKEKKRKKKRKEKSNDPDSD